MLTKGTIIYIDYTSNTCTINIPVFASAGYQSTFEEDNVICAIPPGIYNGYKVGDVVIIGFEDNNFGKPIILGKLYLGAATESKSENGAVHCKDLVVSNSAVLPADITFNFSAPENQVLTTEVAGTYYRSINDIVKGLQQISSKLNAMQATDNKSNSIVLSKQEVVAGTWIDGTKFYRRVFEYSENTILISIQDIAYKNIWIDGSNSFYYDSANTISPLLGAAINKQYKSVMVPATAKGTKGYLVLCYTK